MIDLCCCNDCHHEFSAVDVIENCDEFDTFQHEDDAYDCPLCCVGVVNNFYHRDECKSIYLFDEACGWEVVMMVDIDINKMHIQSI